MNKKKDSIEIVKSSLDIDEAIEHHKKGWIIQRIGWLMMFLVILTGALGLFGEGIISKKKVQTGNFTTEFDKFLRYEAEMKILVQSTNEAIQNISLPKEYIKNFRILRFVPEPLNNYGTGNDVTYNFSAGQQSIITIYMIPQEYGLSLIHI